MNGKNGMENPRAAGALNAAAAERAIIGALLNCGGKGDTPITRLAAIDAECPLQADDFYDSRHRQIWNVLRQTISLHGARTDSISLQQALKEFGKLQQAGGFDYIADLEKTAPADENAARAIAQYAIMIKRAAGFRRAHNAAADLQARLLQPGGDADAAQIVSEELPRFSDIGANSAIGEQIIYLPDIPPDDDTAPKIKSGITALDDSIGDFRGGAIYCIGGASGAGKTSLAAQIAAGADAALIIANDQSLRLWRALLYAQHGGELPVCEFGFLRNAKTAANAAQIARVWAAARYAKNAKARLCILCDMSQSLLPGGDTNPRADSSERTTALMAIMQKIADDTGAIILLNCATRKSKDERGGKNPNLDSLREGGDLAYKADGVILIGDDDDGRMRTLRIAKNRQTGERCTLQITLGLNRKFALSAGAENATAAASANGAKRKPLTRAEIDKLNEDYTG